MITVVDEGRDIRISCAGNKSEGIDVWTVVLKRSEARAVLDDIARPRLGNHLYVCDREWRRISGSHAVELDEVGVHLSLGNEPILIAAVSWLAEREPGRRFSLLKLEDAAWRDLLLPLTLAVGAMA